MHWNSLSTRKKIVKSIDDATLVSSLMTELFDDSLFIAFHFARDFLFSTEEKEERKDFGNLLDEILLQRYKNAGLTTFDLVKRYLAYRRNPNSMKLIQDDGFGLSMFYCHAQRKRRIRDKSLKRKLELKTQFELDARGRFETAVFGNVRKITITTAEFKATRSGRKYGKEQLKRLECLLNQAIESFYGDPGSELQVSIIPLIFALRSDELAAEQDNIIYV